MATVSIKDVLLQDSNDLYNMIFKWIIWPTLFLHSCRFLLYSHQTLPNIENGGYLYESSDVGLNMTISSHFPWIYLNGHSYFAMLSVLLIIIQKQLISMYAHNKIKSLVNLIRNYVGFGFWDLHRMIGILTLSSVLIFDINGFLMGVYSDWDKFDVFSYFFFAPWIFMIIFVYISAKMKWFIIHRYVSNMLLKACIVTPIARIAGSICQNIGIWGDEYGYYYGIGAVTLFSTLWLLYELPQMFPSKTK